MKPRLSSSDWFAVIFLVGLMAALGAIIHISRPARLPALDELPQVRVRVEGAVHQPGWVSLPEGSTVGELLRRVELTDEAQVRSLRKRRPLEEGEVLSVPQRKGPAPVIASSGEGPHR